ncbi:MAG: 7-carboxy-7-deazaguanine synthase QueE [Dehalococcoidia bacterium]|nr:7-carboxy-7-deazaguanine synthase QueE [Dehalococcoidia bacterium]
MSELLEVSRKSDGQPEIFQSIQGEGASAGTPSVFLRLAQCNLRCAWCDTKYTWDWAHFDQAKETTKMSVEDICNAVSAFGMKRLIITGGEPLLHQDKLFPLCKWLKSSGYVFEIETNGTITPSPEMLSLIDQWNVSPKLANSGNSPQKREITPALKTFASSKRSFFKFVISEESDVKEVEVLADKYCISKEQIILMPQAATKAALNMRSAWLTKLCEEKGYRFSSRLHIMLWGNKRGV